MPRFSESRDHNAAAPPPARAPSAGHARGNAVGAAGHQLWPGGEQPPADGLGVGRVRLYDADPATLRSFANTGIELVVGVPDECLATVSTPSGASSWVRSVIQPALPATKIAVLAVGNEVLTGANSSTLTPSLQLVMRLVGEGKGTPLRPDGALRVYMFALFNENMKPGPSSERNYGLFKRDGTPVYKLAYRLPKDNATTSSAGGGGYNGHGDGQQNNGYYSITASAKANMVRALLFALVNFHQFAKLN
ncbi:hypothetical protein ZWY2020_037321 [Hordeum vulgare]|nr:hypothetical protein ZWY2020_037321 [Hordeum vulgare]